MRLMKTLVAAAAVAMVGLAHAGTTTFTVLDASPVGINSIVTFDAGVGTADRSTTEYVGTSTNPAGTFAAFCLEPNSPLTSPWTYMTSGFTPSVADALSKLFTGADWRSWDYLHDGVTQDFQKIGLGLAVWDIAADGTFDLSGGNFRVLNDGLSGAAVAFANFAYAHGNTSMASSLILLHDPIKQDLVIAIPEPSTYALLMAGLLAVGFVARRRSAKRG